MLKGKQGRFRQNLLGKRVDYSGRSVIVVGPELRMHQCGLPKEMALELFKPFVMKRLVNDGHAQHIKTAKRLVDRASDVVWDILEDVIKDHPVMLNRAPTLHRLGIQAFEPILVEGRAIKLHPLVCTAFNADFDGDQMAVHVPLSAEAQAEARFLMLSSNNLLKPQDGMPVTVPTQDMILGCYYLTIDKEGEHGENMVFSSLDEAIMAYDEHYLELHAPIRIRVQREVNGVMHRGLVKSTLGRFIFNEIIPQNLEYVDRTIPGNELLLECDFLVGKKALEGLISRAIRIHGIGPTAQLLDNIKSLGYKYSTRGGISIGIEDMIVPDVKEKMIKDAEEKVEHINRMYQRGMLNEDGRFKTVISVWNETTDAITEELKKNLGKYNPIKMMSDSGARGQINQIKQLAGMRGNMTDTSGKTIEIPIKSNLREGMNVLEFFISSHGARKALSDTALKTADSGYLTRRLVDVAQDVIITEEDCGTDDFTYVTELAVIANDKKDVIKSLSDRLTGRYSADEVIHPKTGEVLIGRNELFTQNIASAIEAAGITRVKIRSVFDCRSPRGVCSHCYGINLATGETTIGGEAVGIMAAQSIGEPGTQLTMRTFHTGGIASVSVLETEQLAPRDGIVRYEDLKSENVEALTLGLANLEQHIQIIGSYHVPLVVALNRFVSDTEAEIQVIKDFCLKHNVAFELNEAWEKGSEGAKKLALSVMKLTDGTSNYQSLFKGDEPIEDRILKIATTIYGAKDVSYTPLALSQLEKIRSLGLGNLNVCIAKTQASLSDDPKKLCRPTDFTLNVQALNLSLGAGFVVAIAGSIMTMPGLSKDPAALHIDILPDGKVVGLF